MSIARVIIVILALIAVASAMKVVETRMMRIGGDNAPAIIEPTSSDKECADCADAMLYVVNVVLNDILQGELSSCKDLCKFVNKTELMYDTCLGVCDIVGVKLLVKLINETDPSPIYVCQVAKMCAEVSGGAVTITSLYVSPTTGVEGTTFQIFFNYNVTSATSAGLISMAIAPPDQEPSASDIVTNGQPIGAYSLEMTFETYKHGMTIGAYGALAGICSGDCETTHPYSGVYAASEVYFNITKAN